MTAQEACNQIGIEYKAVATGGKPKPTPVIGKGPRNTSGRIKLFSDGTGGIVFNNIDGTQLLFWFDDTPPTLTAADTQGRIHRANEVEHIRSQRKRDGYDRIERQNGAEQLKRANAGAEARQAELKAVEDATGIPAGRLRW